MSRAERQLPTFALLVAAALLTPVLACGGGERTPGPATATTPAVSRTPSPTAHPPSETPAAAETQAVPAATLTSTPVQTPFSGTRGPVDKEAPAGTPVAILTDMRFAPHQEYDRVVFEFKSALPGYRIEYVHPPITKDPSDLPVDIAGAPFLKVRFRYAAAHDEAGAVTYPGPMEIVANFEAIIELEQIGDFEGQVTWVLGLASEADFRVAELESPYRVVIDVAHTP